MKPTTIELARFTVDTWRRVIGRLTDQQVELMYIRGVTANLTDYSNSAEVAMLATEILRHQESPVTTVAE